MNIEEIISSMTLEDKIALWRPRNMKNMESHHFLCVTDLMDSGSRNGKTEQICLV